MSSQRLLFGCDPCRETTAATDAVFEIVRNGLEPAAIEYLDQRVIKAMSEYKGLGLPNADALILLEMHGIDDHVIDMMNECRRILVKHGAFEHSIDTEVEDALIFGDMLKYFEVS